MNKELFGVSTNLSEDLAGILPDGLPAYLEANRERLEQSPRPFSDYVRRKLREKGIPQQNLFLAADLSENYGYKLISGEKRTINRDILLRICIVGHFTLDETQEALILYGMAPLHPRLPRDLVFITAIMNRICDIHEVNELLIRCFQRPLLKNAA